MLFNSSDKAVTRVAIRNQIVFEPKSSQAPDFDAEHSAIPQLHFRCTLEGPQAICHMPLEGGRSAQPSAPQDPK